MTAAPDGPGALSHFDLARKDCLGTARNTASKVWYTVANGVLSDVYYPTVDNTNVETLPTLGQPGPGYGFTVVLTGQDGFSSDQARGFASTPQDFQFGVCATQSSDPHCTVDPGTVPKAMDVITPAGVAQSTELDYTAGPVVLQGVTIP